MEPFLPEWHTYAKPGLASCEVLLRPDLISLVAADVHQRAEAIKGRQNVQKADWGERPGFQTELDV